MREIDNERDIQLEREGERRKDNEGDGDKGERRTLGAGIISARSAFSVAIRVVISATVRDTGSLVNHHVF